MLEQAASRHSSPCRRTNYARLPSADSCYSCVLHVVGPETLQAVSVCQWAAEGLRMAGIPVTILFSGGAELLFNNEKRKDFVLPPDQREGEGEGAGDGDGDGDGKEWTLKRLIRWLRDEHLQERPELFVEGETVRPGILVLVNDTDWELLGELDYRLRANDTVLFISTLHGG